MLGEQLMIQYKSISIIMTISNYYLLHQSSQKSQILNISKHWCDSIDPLINIFCQYCIDFSKPFEAKTIIWFEICLGTNKRTVHQINHQNCNHYTTGRNFKPNHWYSGSWPLLWIGKTLQFRQGLYLTHHLVLNPSVICKWQ